MSLALAQTFLERMDPKYYPNLLLLASEEDADAVQYAREHKQYAKLALFSNSLQ